MKKPMWFIINTTPALFINWLDIWLTENIHNEFQYKILAEDGSTQLKVYSLQKAQINVPTNVFGLSEDFKPSADGLSTMTLIVAFAADYDKGVDKEFRQTPDTTLEFQAVALASTRTEITVRLLSPVLPLIEFFYSLLMEILKRWPEATESLEVMGMSTEELYSILDNEQQESKVASRVSSDSKLGMLSRTTPENILTQKESTLEDRRIAGKFGITTERFLMWKKERYLHQELLLKYAEIAARLNVSESKVKTDMSAMKKIGFYDPSAT